LLKNPSASSRIDSDDAFAGGYSAVPNATYQARRSLYSQTEEYSLTDNALVWPGGSAPFSDVDTLRIYSVPGMSMLGFGQVMRDMQQCAIYLKSGKSIQLSSLHFLGFGKTEDRSPAFIHFVGLLAARVRAANPSARFFSGMPPGLWWTWFLIFGSLVLGLFLCIVLGLVGMTMAHQITLGTSIMFVVLAVLLIGPITFLRATWRRRTRTLNAEDIPL
jgi:hypothetical protein